MPPVPEVVGPKEFAEAGDATVSAPTRTEPIAAVLTRFRFMGCIGTSILWMGIEGGVTSCVLPTNYGKAKSIFMVGVINSLCVYTKRVTAVSSIWCRPCLLSTHLSVVRCLAVAAPLTGA